MPKSKKPAPKGGKKATAPKKVAKRVKQALPPIVPTTDAALKRLGVKPSLTARQIDQFNADKMRADSAIAANKNFVATPDDIASLKKTFVAVQPFVIPAHPTVEEQYLAAKDAYAHTLGDAESLALHRAEQARALKPAKRGWFARFRSAVTGLWVSKKFAEANPDTTVREKVD